MEKHPLNWFEIAATDVERAARFYETMLGIDLRRDTSTPVLRAIFPGGRTGNAGCLAPNPNHKPSEGGTSIFFNATGKLDDALVRATQSGGAVVTPKTSIGPNGFFAMVRDTEGNVVGLHSEP